MSDGKELCGIYGCDRYAYWKGVCVPCATTCKQLQVPIEVAIDASHDIARDEFEQYLHDQAESKRIQFDEFYARREIENNPVLAQLDEDSGEEELPVALRQAWYKAGQWIER